MPPLLINMVCAGGYQFNKFQMGYQKELAGIIGKSERTIKTRTVEMQEKGLIRRENGKRNGRWEVLVKL